MAASGGTAELQRRHAAYFLALAEQGAWLDRLEREHDNLRVALKWARERDEMETGMRVARSLWRFWYTRGHAREGQEWFEGLLAQTEGDGECSPSVVVRVQRARPPRQR